MKRYSIIPTSSRRKSGVNVTASDSALPARQILDQLDQDTTFVLQEIDKNISRATAVINDKIIPMLQEYDAQSSKVWENTGFWKHFFEQSANVELDSYAEPISELTSNNQFLLLNRGSEDGEEEEEEEEGDDRHAEGSGTQVPFKKPIVKHVIVDEDTPTWSTEQTRPSMKSLMSPTRRTASNLGPNRDATKLTDSISLHPPSLTSGVKASSPVHHQRQYNNRESPIKIHTIRQSLDTYHRVSISPKKQKTPIRSARSDLIENILNSSPSFPLPPILRSEIGSETPRQATSSPIKQGRTELRKRQATPMEDVPDLQMFPNTPKYSRLSGSSFNSPLKSQLDDEDSDLQPPQLDSDKHEGGVIEPSGDSDNEDDDSHGSENLPLPELNTIELSSNPRKSNQSTPGSGKKRRRIHNNHNDDADNVFLDNGNNPRSNNSTSFFSTAGEHEDNVETTSKSFLEIYDQAISKIRDRDRTRTDNNELTKDVTQELTKDLTENSTADLGPLKERWRRLSKKIEQCA